MFVKARWYNYSNLSCKINVSNTTWLSEPNKYFRNYLENIPIITITWINTQASPGKNYLILDYYLILLLYTLPSVPGNCISIKLYRSVMNPEIGLLWKKT